MTNESAATSDYSSLYASFLLRLGTAAFDWLIIILIFSIIRWVISLVPVYNSPFVLLILLPIVSLLYNVLFIYKTGCTLGKKFAGIKVIKENGVISLKDSFLREAILKPLSFILAGSGFIYMFFNSKKQTYYDKILNLSVIKYSKLNLIKKIILIVITFFYCIYLIQLSTIPKAFYKFTKDYHQEDVIESIKAKAELLGSVRAFVKEYGNEKKLDLVKSKQEELCSKRYFGLFGTKNCQLEDLSIKSLNELDKAYEDLINYIYKLQIEGSDK